MSKRSPRKNPSNGADKSYWHDRLRSISDWFERQKRVLPWRDEPTPYRVWISEIMLQQTQVVTVVPYFERFLERFPTVESLAAAPEAEVMLHWAGLGYYSRARNLHRAAQRIVAAGRFPVTREEWLEVPGVGPYTAGAIRSISGDVAEPILDGNVERVLSRVRCLSRGGGDATYKARLWRLARRYVERAAAIGLRPSVMNQALMELGATVCTPRGAKCAICPLADVCRANARQCVESFPPRKKPKEWIEVREEVHCVVDAATGRVLVRQRSAGEWRSGLWDLLDEQALATLSLPLKAVGEVESRHVVTRHKIQRRTRVWQAPPMLRAGEPMTVDVMGPLRWLDPGAPDVAVGSALKKSLALVRQRYFSAASLDRIQS